MARIKITQVRSGIGHDHSQRRTLKSLGLRRINHSVVHNDSMALRGMINKVRHLVKVEEQIGQAE